MSLEHGFRRLLVVLSIAAIGAGIALDAGKLSSHAKIYVTLKNGDTESFDTWNLVGSPPYERDPSTWKMVNHLFWESLEEEQPEDALDPVAPPEKTQKRGAPRAPTPRGQYLSDTPSNPSRDPLEGAIRIDPVIRTFRVVHGPFAWSREDFRFTLIAAGVVALLWVGFFAVGWVARGFTAPLSR